MYVFKQTIVQKFRRERQVEAAKRIARREFRVLAALTVSVSCVWVLVRLTGV